MSPQQRRRRNKRNSNRSRFLRQWVFESLESRLMLAADLQYPGSSLVSDFTLQVQSGGSAPVLKLTQTGSSTVISQVTLSFAGDSTVNIRASDLKDLRGDTLRIDMTSLSLLNTFVSANGGFFTVVFDGGLDIATGLPLPVFDDSVRLEGTGSYSIGFGFGVQSSSDITIAAGSPTFSGAFTAKSLATTAGKADTTDLTQIFAVPQTAIAMSSGKITATNITLQAVSTVDLQINATTPLGDSIRFGTVVVFSDSKVDVSGTAQARRLRHLAHRCNIQRNNCRATQATSGRQPR